MLFMLQCLLIISAWEICKYVKRQWKLAEDRSNGLRWECPDCKTVFASSDKAIVTAWVVDHDMSRHHKDEGAQDA